jgi:uncharacterized protein YndB with AHSA1/START domain
MMATKETVYTKDEANKKIFVKREFDAPVQKVWDAWTKRELLDKWWAPKPWKAVTRSIDFRDGGNWLYYMQGPEGEKHNCLVEYTSIIPGKAFSGIDAFCDENGKILTEFPTMHWKVEFHPEGNTTRVEVEISFQSDADMEKIIEMGFKEGFAAAHTNLDELLASQ